MELCAAFPEPGCVGTGETAVAEHPLYTAFLGTCTAALASKRGACALIHYDEMRAGMFESAVECARSFAPASWRVVRGPRATRSAAECVAALAAAGSSAPYARATSDEARVRPD
jgi:hypothetical protein